VIAAAGGRTSAIVFVLAMLAGLHVRRRRAALQ
jgi:hypothetical protein